MALGYAARVFIELVRKVDLELLLGGSPEVALAVGWDSGSPLDIGSISPAGLRLRSAAQAAADQARSAAAAATFLAELEARQSAQREAAFRRFTHSDGRQWGIAEWCGAVELEFTDAEGVAHHRTLTGFEGTPLAAAMLIRERLDDGFVEVPAPTRQP